jgi:uncharacterized membrane protein YkoI
MKSMTLSLRSVTLPLLLSSLTISSGLLAGDKDHDRAREAMEAGKILPLRTIIDKLDRDYPGQILEVELDHEDGQWLYEIKMLRDSGALIKLELDAGDGTLIRIKGRDIAPQEGRP